MSWGSRAGDALRRTTPALHTQNTTAARPTVHTHKPAVENRPRVRLFDLFERAKPRSGPSLTGERRPLSFRDGSVTANANGVTVSAGGSAEIKGLKIKFGTEISRTSNVESKDGFTTLTAEGSMSVNLGGEVDLKTVGFGANYTEGVKTKYELRMSDADYAKVRSGQAPVPDPYNPDTMPAGSSVMLNSSDFKSTGFEASYKKLKLETNVSEEQGLSVAVEKTGANTVRVTAGPTEAVENSWKLGLSLGPASVHIGNTTRLDAFKLKTAEFDLSTGKGRAAYNAFLTTGKLPTQNGNGISNVATVEKLQYNSTSSAGVSLGPFSGSIDLSKTTLDVVKTTYPDGSVDQVTDAKDHGGTPVHVEQHFRPDGTEDFSKQKISMFLRGATGGTEGLFATAYDADPDSFDGDNDIHLSFNADQAMALSRRAQEHIARWERDHGEWSDTFHTQEELLIDALAKADNPTDVARALIGAYGGPYSMGYAFADMATAGDELEPLPGTLEARNRND